MKQEGKKRIIVFNMQEKEEKTDREQVLDNPI